MKIASTFNLNIWTPLHNFLFLFYCKIRLVSKYSSLQISYHFATLQFLWPYSHHVFGLCHRHLSAYREKGILMDTAMEPWGIKGQT